MKRMLLTYLAFSLVAAGCGLAAPDTQATVAAQVKATVEAAPVKEVTVEVPVEVPVTQQVEVIITQPVEVPVTVVVTAPPPDGGQATAVPGDTPAPEATTPPEISTTGQDPLAGANVTPIIDERFDFPDKYYWWLFGSEISSSGEGVIEDETYILTSKETENYEWTFGGGRKLQNFYLSASAVIPDQKCKQGDHWGLAFRHVNNDNFYMFGVSCDGKYSLMKRVPDGFETLLPPTDSPAIKKLGQLNVLGVRAVGNQISLYANNQFLVTVADGSLTEGFIGMYVRTLLTPQMSVVYDDIMAYVINQ